mgnify:FL=1|jgi:hypothetical protein
MNYKDYFEKRDAGLPKPKWVYGDRVFSKFKGTPTIGMVIRERDKEVLIHSDLPVKIGKVIHNIISVPVRDVKRLKEM